MSFLKSTDYSGGRAYDREPAARVLVDHFRLRAALTFGWAKLNLDRFIQFIAAPTKPSPPVHRGFSVIGAKQKPLPARRPITDVFPIPDSADHPRKTRNRDQSGL